jgi:tRNA(fMet)-specific endonuclease VapC
MTIRYLIDTDWIIDHLNQIEPVVTRLKELRPQGLALSIVSLAELWEGVQYSRDPAQSRRALEAFLEDVAVLGIDEKSARASGGNADGCEKQDSSSATLIC